MPKALSYAIGFIVTFLVGGLGTLLPIVGTQAMSGDESFTQIASGTIPIYVIVLGGSALLGFVTLARSNFRTYACIVAGFVAGGALGGLLLSIGIVSHIGVLWVLGPIVPFAVGGYVAWAVAPAPVESDTVSKSTSVTKAVLLTMAMLGLVWFLVGAFLSHSRENARQELSNLARSNGDDALYNALRELDMMQKASVSNYRSDALEVYVAVRYRERLASGEPLKVPAFQPLATRIAERHADKTDVEMDAVLQLLGRRSFEQLNRPYR